MTPLVAAIEARIDVQDAKIETQDAKIESLTAAIGDLSAAAAARNARLGALCWMFGSVIAPWWPWVFNPLFPAPSVGPTNSGSLPRANSAEPSEPTSEAGSVTPSPAAVIPEPAQAGEVPLHRAAPRVSVPADCRSTARNL